MSKANDNDDSFSSPKTTKKTLGSTTTFKSPKTPKSVKSPKKSPKPHGSPMKVPDNWKKQTAWVYSKHDDELIDAPNASIPMNKRGIWTSEYNVKSPTEVWLFPHGQEPMEIHHSKYDAFGVYGYKPGGDPDNMRNYWFYPPKKRVPAFFTTVGIWTFPYVKPETAHIAPDSVGFVEIGEAVKMKKLDVGGKWRLLYQKDGLPKKTKLNLKVRTWKNEIIPLENCKSTDTIDSIKQRIADTRADLPKSPQNLYHDGEFLESAATLGDYHIPNDGIIDLEGMQIYIEHEKTKRKFLLAVDGPGTTIGAVKKLIQEKENIPSDQQSLSFQGTKLDKDTKTLTDYKIKHLAVLNLQEQDNAMTVYVQEYDGPKLPLKNVKATQTIDETKNQIEKQHGIPKRDQRLVYQSKPLKEKKKTLQDYKIPSGAVLQLVPMQITVTTPDGKKQIELMGVKPKTTIAQIKKMVHEKEPTIAPKDQRLIYQGENLDNDMKTLEDHKIPNGATLELSPMQLFIKNQETGKTFPIHDPTLTPRTTVNELKAMVEQQDNFPKKEQRLVTKDGQELSNGAKPLSQYGIQHGDTLNLANPGMEITVVDWMDNKYLLTDMKPFTTIDNIKDMLETYPNIAMPIPKGHQRLHYQNKLLSKNDKTLKECKIPNKAQLVLEGMEIFIQDLGSGKKVPIPNLHPHDTVGDLKDKVEQKLGTPKDQQRLIYKGKELKDNKPTLDDSGIQHGSTLDLDGMKIHVKTPDGKKLTLAVKPTDTVDSAKSQIKNKTKTPKDEQRLLFKKKELSDKLTLKDCGIKHDDTLDLEGMRISVNTPDGKKLTLSVKPTDTIDDVKQQIKNKTNKPKDEQRLLFKKKELDDTPTLKDCGIKHDDTLDLEGMQITVNTPDGKQLTLDVKPTDTVDDVKEQIKNKTKTPKDEQRLLFKKKELDYKPTLKDCGIKNNDTLDLEGMQITVNTPDGKQLTLDVKPTDTVDDVKEQIKNKTKTPKDEQRLLFKKKELDDKPTLKDCGIKNNDTLDLDGMKIMVNTPDGKKLTLDVKPTDTVDSVKSQIEGKVKTPKKEQRLLFKKKELNDKPTLKDCGIKHNDALDLEGMQISVNTPDGKKLTLNVKPTDTVDDVKEQIKNKTNKPKDEQRLLFKKKELSDKPTLTDCGIKHNDVLDLEGMQISVNPPGGGKPLTLDVKPSDTIDDVKKKIAKQHGIPKDDQRLNFKGKSLDDKPKKSLDDCGIKHGSTLDMGGMQINIKDWAGKVLTMNVSPTDTIADIKQHICEQKDLPIDIQHLFFERKSLDKDSKTLSDHKIKHQSTLDLERMKIYIKTWDDKTFPLDVAPQNTVAEIKTRIESKEGVSPGNQYLMHGGKLLEDVSSLKDCGIRHRATVNLERMKIYVKTWNGKTFTLDVDPDNTVLDIKKKIAIKENMAPRDQQLRYNDAILKDEPTLRECDVKYKSTINLEQKPKEEIKSPKAKAKKMEVEDEDEEIDPGPQFRVHMDSWQDPFAFSPKTKAKKLGTRTRKNGGSLADFYGTATNTETAPWKEIPEDKRK